MGANMGCRMRTDSVPQLLEVAASTFTDTSVIICGASVGGGINGHGDPVAHKEVPFVAARFVVYHVSFIAREPSSIKLHLKRSRCVACVVGVERAVELLAFAAAAAALRAVE